jgi:hypothetical protein
MSFNSYYYPEEHEEVREMYCEGCDFYWEKEVTVSNGYYEADCPKCKKTVSVG